MQQSTTTLLGISGALAVIAVVAAVVAARLRARRSRRDSLEDPLEMSTLTFPPGSLKPRRRSQRA